LKLPRSRKFWWSSAVGLVFIFLLIYYLTLPVAAVATVRRGTAIAAVYGTVRIEPTFVVPVRAQSSGFIRFADDAAVGKNVAKGQLVAMISDEATARELKQARADLQAANERAALPLPSEELLKGAEDNLQRVQKLTSLNNVPVVEYEKAKSDVNRLRAARDTERIERDRNLATLEATCKKLEAQMKTYEVRVPIEGVLTGAQVINGELVGQGNPVFMVSSRKTYVRGEINEEDVGAVKNGMKATVQLYAYRAQSFTAHVSSIQPAADPATQRYTIALNLEKPPDNLMSGMTGEMNIITGTHENAVLVPTRALLVDQALIVKHGIVHRRTVEVGFRTLDFAEVLDGVDVGDDVVVEDQDRLRIGQFVRRRLVQVSR
jgi:RND family efflux transporter MFP subunit